MYSIRKVWKKAIFGYSMVECRNVKINSNNSNNASNAN